MEIKSIRKSKNISGRLLRRMRKSRGWTQETMAEKLRQVGWTKCKRSWLARIETGEVFVKDFQLGFLREVFGEEYEDLFWSVARSDRRVTAPASAGEVSGIMSILAFSTMTLI